MFCERCTTQVFGESCKLPVVGTVWFAVSTVHAAELAKQEVSIKAATTVSFGTTGDKLLHLMSRMSDNVLINCVVNRCGLETPPL